MDTKSRHGFTIVEMLIASALLVVVMVSLVFAWVNVYTRWREQNAIAHMRKEMAVAVRRIREDLTYTSINIVDQMFFARDADDVIRAVSFPRPTLGSGGPGRFARSDDGRILAFETVIYHYFQDPDTGETSLRRSRLPRAAGRGALQIEVNTVFANGSAVPLGGVTEDDFMPWVEDFHVEPYTEPVDFYVNSDIPQRTGIVHFGWAEIDQGDNRFTVEIVGQNPASTGTNIGIDRIMIEPAGAPREMEFYANTITGTVNVVSGGQWSARNYLELVGGVNATFNFSDDYDLLRESAFDNASFSNVRRNQEANQIEVALPLFPFFNCGHAPGCECDSSDASNTAPGDRWHANYPTGAVSASPDLLGNGFPVLGAAGGADDGVAIRTVIPGHYIHHDGDFVRIAVESTSLHPLRLRAAFITRKDGAAGSDMTGIGNALPLAGQEPGDYHYHQQLFFKDGAGQLSPGVTVGAGPQRIWSEWTAFPVDEEADYLITLAFDWSVADGWTGARFQNTVSPGAVYSCLQYGAIANMIGEAGSPAGNWAAAEGVAGSTSPDIWVLAEMQSASRAGYVESFPFDTSVSSPHYQDVTWTETRPGDADISVHLRTGRAEHTDEFLWGSWEDCVVVTSPGSSVSLPSYDFVQFRGHLDADVSWRSNGTERSYSDYVAQLVAQNPWDFVIGGRIYATHAESPSLDDVAVRWDARDARYFCRITGFIARKNDYGKARLLVNGQELISSLRVFLKLSEDIRGREISQEATITVRPLNTGKFD